MSLVDWSTPNMINGVSQQPPSLRHRSQCEEMINGFPSVVEGMGMRFPTEHVAKLVGATSPAHLHTINRDATERYKVVMTDDDLFVYDFDGTAKTVAFPDGKGYLNAANATTAFEALSIADYTFITNREVSVALSATLSADRGFEALVLVKQGNYSSDYEIAVDGTTRAAKVTLSNATAANADDIRTNDIATDLETELDANLPNADAWATTTAYVIGDVVLNSGNIYTCVTAGTSAGAGGPTGTAAAEADNTVVWDYVSVSPLWLVDVQNATIHIRRTDGVDFEIKVTDSNAGNDLKLAKTTVTRFTDLPTTAPTDYVVEVQGDAGSIFDNYYVKFVPHNAGATFDTGEWVETVAPGLANSFDASTMPHLLVREGDGTFTFREATEWLTKGAGNDTTNVNPSFIGSAIESFFFWKNRLGFIWNHGVVQSEAGEFFNFFRTTVTTKLATDRIDVGSTHTRVANLEYGVPSEEQVIIFSDTTEFRYHSNGDPLTAESVEMEPTTEFGMVGGAAPVPLGTNIYFPQVSGLFSGIREYLVGKVKARDAADVTSHVPKYVKGGITGLTGSETHNVLVASTDTEQNIIYPYFYYWGPDGDKLQSAWSKWQFDSTATVLDIAFIENYLYLIIEYGSDGLFLERMRVDTGWNDPNAVAITSLDRRVTESDCTYVYDAGTNRTTITLPYPATGTMKVITRNAGGATIAGKSLPVLSSSGAELVVSGDHSSTPMYAGQSYALAYTFAEQTWRQGGLQSKTPTTRGTGRLQVLRLFLRFANTSGFAVAVTPEYRDTSTTTFTGRILGSGQNVIDATPLEDGVMKAGVRSRADRVAITVTSLDHRPCWFQGADWEGNYTNRSKRV